MSGVGAIDSRGGDLDSNDFPWDKFELRLTKTLGRVQLDQLMDILTLSALSVSLTRHWADFSVWERGHILVHMALVLAGLLWRMTDRFSYVRWRHWLAPVLRVSLISGPGAWRITTLALNHAVPWGSDRGWVVRAFLGSAAVLLFASAVATNCTMALARSVMLPLHVATQAVVLGILLYVRGIVCASPMFHSPTGRALLVEWYAIFNWLSALGPTPAGSAFGAAPRDSTALCRSVLGFIQLWVGFIVPVAIVAFAEARCFVEFEAALEAQHAREQREQRHSIDDRQPTGQRGAGSRRKAGPRCREWLCCVYRELAKDRKDGFFVWPAATMLLAAAAWEAAITILR